MNDGAGPAPTGVRPAALGFILVTVALDTLSFGIVIPVLPFLIAGFLGGDLARAADVNGVFGTAWAAMQFLFSPFLGALSDRFGRRTVLLTSLVGLGLDYVLMATAPTLVLLFVGRVISGITAATYSTAYAYIADTTAEGGRARAFGLVGAAWGVAFMGLYSPASQALMTRLVDASEQGRLQGANSSLMGIAGLIAPLLYNGVLAAVIAAPLSVAGAPFYVASLLLVAALALRGVVREPQAA